MRRILLPPGDLAVASREELADNTRANVGGREFSNCKQTVTRFSGLSEEFPVWSKCFVAFTSMNGCWNYILTDKGIAEGDTAKGAQYFLSHGLDIAHIKKSTQA